MKPMNNFAMPRPDLAYGGPGPILAVALQEQQASWAFYTSAVATHGNQAPLQTLRTILDEAHEQLRHAAP